MHFLFSLLAAWTVFAAAPPEPKVFRVRLAEDLGTLDWNYGEVSPEVIYQVMEGLFKADKDGHPEGAAVKTYKWNDDFTKLTLFLKPSRKWSDGSPLCAQQFVDSWNRLRDKKFGSPYAHYASVLKHYEAKSCRELQVSFTRPAREAIALFSHYVFFPIRLDNLAKHPKAFTEGTTLLVNGPFRPAEWRTNQQLTLSRNPFYEEKPAIASVEFYFIPDDGTAKTLFEQGQLDWVRDLNLLLRTPKLEKGGEFRLFPSLTSYYFGLNGLSSLLLKDPTVRYALGHTLDRPEITKVLGSEYRGSTTWLTPKLFPELKRPSAKTDRAKIKAAKALLAEAVKEKRMDLVIRVYGKEAHKKLAEWAQGQWEKKLGVRIPIEVQEAKVYWKEIAMRAAPIYLSGVTAAYVHPRAYLQEFMTESSANWTGWTSSVYDRAVEEGRFQDAEDALQEQGFVIPLYTRESVALVKKKWQGFAINPLGQAFLADVK
jgi:oligopeptide transport system substrate-binding protein